MNKDSPLYSSSIKIAWAKKHINALDAEAGIYLYDIRRKCPIVIEKDHGGKEIAARFVVPYPPSSYGLIIGDAIGNLRASLDHAICSSVVGSPINKQAFPICSKPEYFPSSKDERLKGVPKDVIAIVKGLQPYGPSATKYTEHPLWVLHQLSNTDKHRQINVSTIKLGTTTGIITGYKGSSKPRHITVPPLMNETEIIRFAAPAKGRVNMEVQMQGTIEIVFEDGPAKGLRPVAVLK